MNAEQPGSHLCTTDMVSKKIEMGMSEKWFIQSTALILRHARDKWNARDRHKRADDIVNKYFFHILSKQENKLKNRSIKRKKFSAAR